MCPDINPAAPLIVVLREFKQKAPTFASGAGWSFLPIEQKSLLLPEQKGLPPFLYYTSYIAGSAIGSWDGTRDNNPLGCFNWFDPDRRPACARVGARCRGVRPKRISLWKVRSSIEHRSIGEAQLSSTTSLEPSGNIVQSNGACKVAGADKKSSVVRIVAATYTAHDLHSSMESQYVSLLGSAYVLTFRDCRTTHAPRSIVPPRHASASRRPGEQAEAVTANGATMRLIHTSDWHLGRTLHGVSLLDHQEVFLDWLVSRRPRAQVDAVAGRVDGPCHDEAVTLLDRALTALFC